MASIHDVTAFEAKSERSGRSENNDEGVCPVVIKQMLLSPEGSFQMFGMGFGILRCVAIVRRIEKSATKISYLLEDHSGDIDAHYWIEEGDEQVCPDVMINTYARVYGTLRQLGKKKTLMIFKMRAVTNLNEITTHLLEVVNARYTAEHYSKKNRSSAADRSSMGGRTFSNMEDENTHGLQGRQLAVFQAIHNYKSEEGISRQELQKKFNHISSHELQNIIDLMTQEGHIYTSIDAEHFLSTDA